MPFALSFADNFFIDGDPESVKPSARPSTVYQAILSMSDETWSRLARDVFHVESERLDPLTVLERVLQTNTCSNLDAPIQVWIDEDGWFDVLVYDSGVDSP